MAPELRTIEQKTSYILALLASSADTPYIGEPVSQLEHSLQCANLAATSTLTIDEDTVIAALLHDIGQFIPSDDLTYILDNKNRPVVDMLVPESVSMDKEETGNSTKMNSVGRVSHDTLGANFLAALGFPEKVTELVGAHVAAKRYLCAVDAKYHSKLSDASKTSLEFQGGPMKGDEKAEFESDPFCQDMCRLRKWDDEAKVIGLEVPGVEAYREKMVKVLHSCHEH
jgi:putative nucleotidyltransferase with HDIG domain